ncbi:glycoside hydrolase family 32 protein [Marinococcus sp. PL1-022]|uniref:glycoside hydrolase family 32 protein n=1 Tax=Marinococcus sp. PL1-022 TaxID=3095363 RepID=UPI0029C17F58|nr:glycoside hydrolase family 32 protein [Marinococcus sp. PL1-022]MDX6153651.1 glycoside hydrolase family 32 protein [Marinococcus sp. PL1-022]
MNHQQQINKAVNGIAAIQKNNKKEYWRPAYHITAPVSWMNDPNGFSMFKDEYHLFYQYHPYSTEWDNMHWGHVKSPDLVHWEHLPPALAPSEIYDRDGCFSGSAVEADGELVLMYTGNVWTGPDPGEDLKQVQCLATSTDGVQFEKHGQNPVIPEAPGGGTHPNHFRDPKVWRENDYYYAVLGSRTAENVGQALLYRSENLLEWEFMNILAAGRGNMGYMWECPDLFRLDGFDVLVMSPQGVLPEGNKYHNLHQAVFAVGDLDLEKGTFDFDVFHQLDHGFDFYAPQTTLDGFGRRIVIGWFAMWESDMPEKEELWAGAMSLPRVLSCEEGLWKCRPLPEMAGLRGEEVERRGIIIENERQIEGVEGNSLELQVVIDPRQAEQCGLDLLANESTGEKTKLVYNTREQQITLDREKSGRGPGGTRTTDVVLENGLLYLHIFVDHSTIEVFMQDGEKVMSARVYPAEASTGVRFFSDRAMELVEIRKWKLSESISTAALDMQLLLKNE